MSAGSYTNPVRVEFGWHSLERLAELIGDRRALLVTSAGMQRRGVAERVAAILGDQLAATWARVEPNPTVAACESAATALQATDAEVVIGLGGGSSLDTAKAVALVRTPGVSPGFLSDLLREGAPLPTDFAPPPLILIPTTAGTGSEVTMWGTVWDDQTGAKHSISDPALYPEVALVDPELTLSLPEDTTVFTALDALSHSMESIWNRNSNPTSDEYAVRAITLIHRSLPAVLREPKSRVLREALCEGSLAAGLAFSNTRTAIAHSISYPLTSSLGVPHGLACSLTLAEVLRTNAGADETRCRLIAEALGAVSVSEAVGLLYRFFSELRLGERLKGFVPTAADLERIEGSFITPGRAGNNLADVDHAGAARILADAYHALTR